MTREWHSVKDRHFFKRWVRLTTHKNICKNSTPTGLKYKQCSMFIHLKNFISLLSAVIFVTEGSDFRG